MDNHFQADAQPNTQIFAKSKHLTKEWKKREDETSISFSNSPTRMLSPTGLHVYVLGFINQ